MCRTLLLSSPYRAGIHAPVHRGPPPSYGINLLLVLHCAAFRAAQSTPPLLLVPWSYTYFLTLRVRADAERDPRAGAVAVGDGLSEASLGELAARSFAASTTVIATREMVTSKHRARQCNPVAHCLPERRKGCP
jgi:hypothetical protein